MSAKAPSSLVDEAIVSEPTSVDDRATDLLIAFTEAAIADDTFLDGVPYGASLALVPDNDHELAAHAIKHGVATVERGMSVYFLYLTHDEQGGLAIKLPEDTLPPLSDSVE